METLNSMTAEELMAAVQDLVKASILRNVKLEFLPVKSKEKEIQDIYTSCPIFDMTSEIFGVPYILSKNRKRIYLTYAICRSYDMNKSEVIYHARNNTLESINRLFKCDGETDKAVDIDVFIPTPEAENVTLITLENLNDILKGDNDGI